MAQLRVAGHLHIEELRAGGGDTQGNILNAKAFQRIGAEALEQLAAAGFSHEGPLVHRGDESLGVEAPAEALEETALHENLFGGKVGEQDLDIVQRTLRHPEGAGGDIQKRDTRRTPAVAAAALVESHCGQEVVLLLREQVIVVGDTRRDEFRDAALDQFFGEFRVFQLVADGHLEAGLHQAGQVVVDGVVGNAGQRGVAARTARAPRQHDSQRLAHRHGILSEGLIEITYPVEQDCIGVLRLDGVPLRDERRFLCFFLGHTCAKVPIFLYICRT